MRGQQGRVRRARSEGEVWPGTPTESRVRLVQRVSAWTCWLAVYMQSSLLHTHCFFGTRRDVAAGPGRGTASSCRRSGALHCGHIGLAFFILASPEEQRK